jgi:hypothetical protein
MTGGIINMFATDEEGKAEGYHPLEPNAEFAIIVNEAKSVSPEIFRALRRCTGYNYWILVSTPGAPTGDFYKAFTTWKHKRRVTFFDCPHLSREEFDSERIELGEHSPLFRSKWLALFTTLGGNFVISGTAMERWRRFLDGKLIAKKFQDWPLRVGIDLAAGGDENVISVWRGNVQVALECFREVDTTKTANRIDGILSELQLQKAHEYIFADDGGVGHAIIDMLQTRGWQIKRVKNNHAARDKKNYKNRGAELWKKFARLVEECILIPLEDARQWEQLATRRHRNEDSTGKLGLERKAEAIADGLASPDRADATVLAFADVDIYKFLSESDDKAPSEGKLRFSAEQIQEMLYKQEFEKAYENVAGGKRIGGSLQMALKQQKDNKALPQILNIPARRNYNLWK